MKKVFVSVLILCLIAMFTKLNNNDAVVVHSAINVLPPTQIIIVTTSKDKIKELIQKIKTTNETVSEIIKKSENKKEIECLAKNIFHEARNQPQIGKVAVAYVVLSRAADNETTICKTVYQKHQFSWVGHVKNRKHNIIEDKAWKEALSIAYLTINHNVKDPTNGAKFYYNPKTAHPHWAKALKTIKTEYTQTGFIGDHLFGNLP